MDKKNNFGNGNTGHYNSGDFNPGYRNSGDSNSGYYNSGDFNTGDFNPGNYNSGNYNFGDYNTGYYNFGNCNSGNFNSSENGYQNYFCTETKYFLFDLEVSKETIDKLSKINPSEWFKFKNKSYFNAWSNCPEKTFRYLESLPEFQTPEAIQKFKIITGINLFPEELKEISNKTKLIQSALSKLTEEEKEALGFI